ncbi:MAG: hypothetical protein R8G34_06675 [Paracoccaceae bacterium]|nr:hypothetical protein [Paracoccaceae bacterium]
MRNTMKTPLAPTAARAPLRPSPEPKGRKSAHRSGLDGLVAAAAQSSTVRALTRLQEMVAGPAAAGQFQARATTVQRAVVVGTEPLRRPADVKDWFLAQDAVKAENNPQGLFDKLLVLHDDRNTIFTFTDFNHLVQCLIEDRNGDALTNPPVESAVPQAFMAAAHERAQTERFFKLNQPSAFQIPEHAPGGHEIDPRMLPPSGQGQTWFGSGPTGTPSLELFSSMIPSQVPSAETEPVTFGDPKNPSMVMDRDGMNLGMHIKPTYDATPHKNKMSRKDATYANLPSVPDRVRGHPYKLADSQKSTDRNSTLTFDNDRRAYTDESDATKGKGGTSSYRYNKLENPNLPFTQVNVDPVISEMEVARPVEIATRSEQNNGSFVDRRWDNSGTFDFRGRAEAAIEGGFFVGGKQAHQDQEAIANAQGNPFPEAPYYPMGGDYLPENRRDKPGYGSPLPTPLIADALSRAATPDEITVNERESFVTGVAQVRTVVEHAGHHYEVLAIKGRASNGTVTLEVSLVI